MPPKPSSPFSTDLAQLRKAVLHLLEGHRGQQRAIPGGELARLLGQRDDRLIRKAIQQLISEGVPIASSVAPPMGYFIVANPAEATDYIETLKNRIREDETRLRAFEAAAERQFTLPRQGSLV